MQRCTWKQIAVLAVGVLSVLASGARTTHAEQPEVFSTWLNKKGTYGWFHAYLHVPAGNYVASAKLFAYSADRSATLVCELDAGKDFDVSKAFVAGNRPQTLTTTVVHSFLGDGLIGLHCHNDGPKLEKPIYVEFVKVTATKVSSISNIPWP